MITCRLCSDDSPLHPVHWESTIVRQCSLVPPSAKEVGQGLDRHSTGGDLTDQKVLQIYTCYSTEQICSVRAR